MPISIRDVARHAGVSMGTVSHVLNGNQRAGIARTTQERVRQVAADLGYQPNRIARSLGRRRTETLGLLISDLQNPFFVALLKTAERMALEAGYHVLVDTMDSIPARQGAEQSTKLTGWPMDGALMWGQPDMHLGQYLQTALDDLPVVYLSGLPRTDGKDAVYFDVYSGACAVMEYLWQRGYRRIAYSFPHPWIREKPEEPRCRAYGEFCARMGMVPQLLLMPRSEESRQAGFEMGCELAAMPREHRPDAVLCFNDVVAQGVLFGVRRAGMRVPADIAIVGFDGLEEGRYLDLPLTTVELPAEPFCREAMRILTGRIKAGNEEGQVAMVPTRLCIGATT